MLFDKLARIVEKGDIFKNLYPIVDKTNLFIFPGRAHEHLPKEILNFEDQKENFILPFSITGVQDTGSLIILIDKVHEQKGFGDRAFIEISSTDTYVSEFSMREPGFEDSPDPKVCSMLPDHYIVTFGNVDLSDATEENLWISGGVNWSYIVDKDGNVMFDWDRMQETAIRLRGSAEPFVTSALRNAATAIQEIIYFNTPNQFILEESPTKVKNSKRLMIKRSHERPIFTILSPGKIHEKFDSISKNTEKRKSPIPHQRRRHPRILKNPRFKENVGKRIIVPAVWIGSSEAIIGNKIYKVRLDL